MATHARAHLRVTAGIVVAGILTAATVAPARAQGLFEMLFGGFRRHFSPDVQSYAEPSDFFRTPARPQPVDSEPHSAFCVRTGDGFYFPVRAQAGVSAAQACRALCPESPTRLYSGGGIEHAVADDGSRYSDLDTAFLYREQLVDGVTCNGHNHFGLARVEPSTDPTLRPGDIVATRDGLIAVTQVRDHVAQFAPLANDRAIPRSTREHLAGVKIMPTAPGTLTPVDMGTYARAGSDSRSAQLSR